MKNYLIIALKWFGIVFAAQWLVSWLFGLGGLYQINNIVCFLIFIAAVILCLREMHIKEGKVNFWNAFLSLLVGNLALFIFGIIAATITFKSSEYYSFSDYLMMQISSSFLMYLGISVAILLRLGPWYAFEKAGQPGYTSIIPIYSLLIMIKIAKHEPNYIIKLIIPIVQYYFMIKLINDFAKQYGKDTGFTVGMVFLGGIFWAILGFDDSKYLPLENEIQLDSFGVPVTDVNMENQEGM